MDILACHSHLIYPLPISKLTKPSHFYFLNNSFTLNPKIHTSHKLYVEPPLTTSTIEAEKPKYKWIESGPEITEAKKQAISQLPQKMTNRCKALMKQLICFSSENTDLCPLLDYWVKIMKPRRADWLVVLKELGKLDNPLFFEVAELALLEESFEANVRDYTKIIHSYGKHNLLQDAENALVAMKRKGFTCDQVTLTTMVHMYSKSGNLKLAEETFEEMKLLPEPLDQRSYGSMIMAYIRAGTPERGENLLGEMETHEIYAGKEVYKALLRAYSMVGDTEGAQRIFDTIQFAGMSPDVRLCGLLINAYVVAGQSEKARLAFENMRMVGFVPSDKCVALVLASYEKENKLKEALEFLVGLESDGVVVEKEASEVLAKWFRRLGVVQEVELVLKEFPIKEDESSLSPSSHFLRENKHRKKAKNLRGKMRRKVEKV